MPTLKELQDRVDADVAEIKSREAAFAACRLDISGTIQPPNYGAAHYADPYWLDNGIYYDAQYCTGNDNKKAACIIGINKFNPKLYSCKDIKNKLDSAKAKLVIDQTALNNFIATDPASQATVIMANADAQIKKYWTYALIAVAVVGALVFIWWKWIRK